MKGRSKAKEEEARGRGHPAPGEAHAGREKQQLLPEAERGDRTGRPQDLLIIKVASVDNDRDSDPVAPRPGRCPGVAAADRDSARSSGGGTVTGRSRDGTAQPLPVPSARPPFLRGSAVRPPIG